MTLSDIPRKPLAFLPTPLVELPRFSVALSRGSGGPRIFIKRDDQTGLATGGNKARKLEFLIGDAIFRGCDTLVTGGAAQSNHCRQTAAAAAACGLDCHLALGGSAPDSPEGNLLLDLFLGAHIHWCSERRKGEDLPSIAESLLREGRKPYLIPYGGSNAVGALGFAAAAGELANQLAESRIGASRVVFASSSGGTQAGLMLGSRLYGLKAALLPICIDKAEGDSIDFADRVLEIANEAAGTVGLERSFARADVILERGFTGGGYGVVGDLERRAIGLLARTEGILVDPVYTGRALGALIELAESGAFRRDEVVVFWHTGGTPALFAYPPEILQRDEAGGQ
jgi:D-cysteine desulfhydrase